jgi:hypothetical protein
MFSGMTLLLQTMSDTARDHRPAQEKKSKTFGTKPSGPPFGTFPLIGGPTDQAFSAPSNSSSFWGFDDDNRCSFVLVGVGDMRVLMLRVRRVATAPTPHIKQSSPCHRFRP